VQPRAGSKQKLQVRPKVDCASWLDLSHTVEVTTKSENQILWNYGLKDILQCLKRELCLQQVIHGPPGTKHRTGR